jgi:hypothetical protein
MSGRFEISPEYQGTLSPQDYHIRDGVTGKKWSGRVRDLKNDAARICHEEIKAALAAKKS